MLEQIQKPESVERTWWQVIEAENQVMVSILTQDKKICNLVVIYDPQTWLFNTRRSHKFYEQIVDPT